MSRPSGAARKFWAVPVTQQRQLLYRQYGMGPTAIAAAARSAATPVAMAHNMKIAQKHRIAPLIPKMKFQAATFQ
jgi:hypothetical protein